MDGGIDTLLIYKKHSHPLNKGHTLTQAHKTVSFSFYFYKLLKCLEKFLFSAHAVLPWMHFVFLLCVYYIIEDAPQENGVQTNQYSSISPSGSPAGQEEPFSTYFEEKVPIPVNASEVGNSSHIFV